MLASCSDLFPKKLTLFRWNAGNQRRRFLIFSPGVSLNGAPLCGTVVYFRVTRFTYHECYDRLHSYFFLAMLWLRGRRVDQSGFQNGTKISQDFHGFHKISDGFQRIFMDFRGFQRFSDGFQMQNRSKIVQNE